MFTGIVFAVVGYIIVGFISRPIFRSIYSKGNMCQYVYFKNHLDSRGNQVPDIVKHSFNRDREFLDERDAIGYAEAANVFSKYSAFIWPLGFIDLLFAFKEPKHKSVGQDNIVRLVENTRAKLLLDVLVKYPDDSKEFTRVARADNYSDLVALRKELL